MKKSAVENVAEIKFLTKKDFKELASIHVYGRGKGRRLRLFFDWCNDFERGIGYKYMVKGYGCTKTDILKDAYDILIKKDVSELCWYDMRVAETDKDRFKIPISG